MGGYPGLYNHWLGCFPPGLMKRAATTLLLLTLGLAIVVKAVWLARSRNEFHEGRHLSQWLADLVATNGEPRAVATVQAIGTNAVPYLLKELSYRYSRPRQVLYDIADRLFRRTLHLTRNTIYDPAQMRPVRAIYGFEALGSTASNAVPPLRRLLGTECGDQAAIALSGIGTAALPAFIEALGDSSPGVRYHALVGLAQLGTNSGPALSAVMGCLDDTNLVSGAPIRGFAVLVLGNMHGEATGTVPALTRLLDDSNPGVQTLARQSLRYIETQREPAP